MSAETAEFLTGTGYHGCRPNSSAERAELAAQQVKCKNCGYRTHNGLNSLCDYCAWMEKYGGGLPPGKETVAEPEATPVPTKKPTEAPKRKDDLYDADDYVHPDDFYYDHRDDFWDYEEAEDYWEEYN